MKPPDARPAPETVGSADDSVGIGARSGRAVESSAQRPRSFSAGRQLQARLNSLIDDVSCEIQKRCRSAHFAGLHGITWLLAANLATRRRPWARRRWSRVIVESPGQQWIGGKEETGLYHLANAEKTCACRHRRVFWRCRAHRQRLLFTPNSFPI